MNPCIKTGLTVQFYHNVYAADLFRCNEVLIAVCNKDPMPYSVIVAGLQVDLIMPDNAVELDTRHILIAPVYDCMITQKTLKYIQTYNPDLVKDSFLQILSRRVSVEDLSPDELTLDEEEYSLKHLTPVPENAPKSFYEECKKIDEVL